MKAIDTIIDFSLRNTLIVILGALLLIGGGIYSWRSMDIDVFPDLTAPTVVLMSEAPGMAAEEVERLVTFPIEMAVGGAADVRRVRSTSMFGTSFVWVEFDWGTDVYHARQVVGEKLAALKDELPQGVTTEMAPQSSVMGEILFVGLQSTGSTSMMELRTLAERVVKPAILGTGGVSQVTVIGGDYRQYRITVHPKSMEAYGISMADVERAAAAMSRNASGGVMREYGNEYAVRALARTTSPEELGRSVVGISSSGVPVMLADVADVTLAPALKMGHASQDASPAVILSVSKQPSVNTLEVTQRIEENLRSVAKSLPADVVMDTAIFRQADFISTSVSNVGRALIEGALLVIVVLYLFLGNLRTTVISVAAIPLSLLGTIVVLHIMGMEINTMTLGGMCIAIGSLVDDAIIDVENVYKRLRQNHMLPPGHQGRRSVFEVVFEASREIRAGIFNATLIIIVAFIPLFFLSGMEGRMLRPLGVAYIVALGMSLLVAMTVTPLMSKLLLSGDRQLEATRRDPWLARVLMRLYSRSLGWMLGHRRVVVGVTALIFGVSLTAFFMLGRSFLPDFNEGSATIALVTPVGTSLDVSNELGCLVEKELLALPEVRSTARRSGRGDLDEHSQATNGAEIDVKFELADGQSRDQLFDKMRAAIACVPGVAATIGQPLGHRIDHMLSGTRANIAVKIFGNDLSQLYSMAQRLKQEIETGVDGVADVSVEQQTETPELQIRANRTALASHGISIDGFNEFVELAFSGRKIGDIYEGQQPVDVVMCLERDSAQGMDAIRNALVETADGTRVPLYEVADIVSAAGPGSVSRENAQRRIIVSANTSGRDVGAVGAEVQKLVDNMHLPEGYRVEMDGQFESARSASRTLLLATVGALLVIFVLLVLEMRRPTLAVIVMASLPFAMMGGVIAIWIASGTLSIPAIIGFITLLGVAVRNGILLVSRYRQLEHEGMDDVEAVIRAGSSDRLIPILMTALTSALALIPLVVAGDAPGNEIQSPMAVVVLGGLLTSTLLNLYLLPIIYRAYALRNSNQ